jgi:virginiamycin B lyase
VRKGAALVAVLLAALAGGASGAQAPARDAKDSLASARQQEAKALDDLLHRRLPAAVARLRASYAALAATLDTLGAAELPTTTTAAIRERLVVAARAKSRAIAALTATPPDTRTAAVAVRGALAGEAKAAALLGDAPGQPTIAELPIPAAVFGAFDMTLDPDGRSVWVSGPDGSRIVLYRSLEPGSTPTVVRLPPGSAPRGIVFGPDKALYIAESGTNIGGNAIGRLLATGELKQFFLPAGAGAPWGITVGPDDKIWFTEVSAGKVGRLDPATGAFREFPLPTPNSQPQGIVLGADGALWGTEAGANRVFRMTADGRATEYSIPTPNSVPVAISPGRFGYLWVSELSGGKLLRVSRTGRMKEFPLPAGARPYGLVSAPDGNVWFADRGRNRIGLVTPAGRVFTFPLATPNAQPTAIVALGLGSFAFTEFVANQVGILRFPTR